MISETQSFSLLQSVFPIRRLEIRLGKERRVGGHLRVPTAPQDAPVTVTTTPWGNLGCTQTDSRPFLPPCGFQCLSTVCDSFQYAAKRPLVLKILCSREGSLLSLSQQENNLTKYYKDVSHHGEMRWGDHLTIPVCWKHQLMTFITNDLGLQAMSPDKLIKKEACWLYCYIQ